MSGYHQEVQRLCAFIPPPPYPRHFFVADLPPLAAEVDLAPLPGAGLVLAHLLGGEGGGGIAATRTGRGGKTKASIFASARQQRGALQGGLEEGSVAEAAIQGEEQEAIGSAQGVKLGPKVASYGQRLGGEILQFLQAA